MRCWIHSGLTALALLAFVGCGGAQLGQNLPIGTLGGMAAGSPSTPGWHEVIDHVSYWQGGVGRPSITINLSEQKAYFFKGGELAGVALVATGKEGYDTPAGTFRILEKTADKHSDTYGVIVDASGQVVNNDADIRVDPIPPGGRFEGAPMPYWMRIVGAIGMHQGPIPEPGAPASHGCIRMSKLVATEFFENAEVGMPVRVVY